MPPVPHQLTCPAVVPIREDHAGPPTLLPLPHHREAGLLRPELRSRDPLRERRQREGGEAATQNSVLGSQPPRLPNGPLVIHGEKLPPGLLHTQRHLQVVCLHGAD